MRGARRPGATASGKPSETEKQFSVSKITQHVQVNYGLDSLLKRAGHLIALPQLSRILGIHRSSLRRGLADAGIEWVKLGGAPNCLLYYRTQDIIGWVRRIGLLKTPIQDQAGCKSDGPTAPGSSITKHKRV